LKINVLDYLFLNLRFVYT